MRITFAVANSTKVIEFGFRDEEVKELSDIMSLTRGLSISDDAILDNWTTYTKEATADRETRQIIVGNMLRAYKNKPEGAKLISFTTHDGEILKGMLVPKNAIRRETVVLSKYSIKSLEKTIKDILDSGEKGIFDLTQGTSLWLNDSKYLTSNSKLIFVTRNPKTYKIFVENKISDFQKFSDDSRTFKEYGYGSNKLFYVTIKPELFNEFIDFLDSMAICVELLPSQVSKYIKDEKKLKMGNWTKLVTNKNNIPSSTIKNDEKSKERKKKLLILAKAKITIAKAKQSKQKN